jgi:acetyl-CoA carboxylase beta subunit
MSQRIALRCPHCQMVSYRPLGFVRAKVHFVCNYCHEIVRIDRRQRTLAFARHESVMEVEGDVLEHTSDRKDAPDGDRSPLGSGRSRAQPHRGTGALAQTDGNDAEVQRLRD